MWAVPAPGTGLLQRHLLPYRGRIFAAPGGITHYIRAHWYQPPDEFIQAITASPDSPRGERRS
jgi:hypothetical protein